MSDEPAPARLLLIALDAVPPSLLEECLGDGSLPNLRSLREEGRWGTVTSDAELFPGSVWPTFFTRSDVSNHGVYHLIQWDAPSRKLRPPGHPWFEVTPFWHRLAASGIRVITLDVPFSDTRRQTPNATEVIGWGMHEGMWAASYPRELLAEVNRRHGRSAQMREGPGDRPDAEIVPDLPGLLADVGRRAAIIEDLAGRFDWRLFLAVFSETHRTAHWFWSERGTDVPQGGVRQMLQAFDKVLPRLRRVLRPQDQLAVFSAHGMGPAEDVDRIGEAALLYLRPPSSPRTGARLDPVYILRHALPMRAVRGIARALPQAVYNWVYYHLQNTRREWSRQEWVIHPLDHLVYLYANLSEGNSGPEAVEAQLAWLRAQFEGMTTLEGQPVVERLFQPGLAYSGPRLHLLPDLVVDPVRRPIGPELVMADGIRRRAPRHNSRDGEHLGGGFYIQVGPGITAGSAGATVPGEELARFLCRAAGLALE